MPQVFVLLGAMTSLGFGSCAGGPPEIRAKQWLGYPDGGSVVASDGAEVKCSEPEFDRFGCYTLEDLEQIWTTVYGCCEKWSKACVLRAKATEGASP